MNKRLTNAISLSLIVLLILFSSACGGGGGDMETDGTPSQLDGPTIDATGIDEDGLRVVVGPSSFTPSTETVYVNKYSQNSGLVAKAEELITEVPWISQIPPCNWGSTANCGPASYLMVEAKHTGKTLNSENSEKKIIGVIDELTKNEPDYDPPWKKEEVFPNRPFRYESSTHITINPVFTTEAAPWSVEVLNDSISSGEYTFQVVAPPAPTTSEEYTFQVVAPTATLSISSVSPNPVTGSNSPQPFTINGTGFLPTSTVTLRDKSIPIDKYCGDIPTDNMFEKLAVRRGFIARSISSQSHAALYCALKNGIPVIVRVLSQGSNGSVDMKDPEEEVDYPCTNPINKKCYRKHLGHYMVLVGMDLDRKVVTVNDPGTSWPKKGKYKEYTLESFIKTWGTPKVDDPTSYNRAIYIATLEKNLPVGIIEKSIKSLSLTEGSIGIPYYATLSAIDGRPPYNWYLVGGNLPDGLSLSQDGVINGTPQKDGKFDFKVMVEDSTQGQEEYCDSIAEYETFIIISKTSTFQQPNITFPRELPNGNVDVFYEVTLSALGGEGPYNWCLVEGEECCYPPKECGSLPNGLYLTQDGVITGTPRTHGEYNFTVKLSDNSSPQQTDSKTFTLTILKSNRDPIIYEVTANPSTLNINETSTITCDARDPEDQQLIYYWEETGGSTSGTGSTITWTAPSFSGTFAITCRVSDGQGGESSRSTSVVVAPEGATFSITPGSQSVNEAAGVATFTVTRSSGAMAQSVYVSTTQTEGYSNSSDYAGLNNQALSFAAGETSKTVTVTIYNDSVVEPNEVFGLIIQQSSNDPVTTYLAKATFTIVNDDATAIIVSISPSSATLSTGGTQQFTATVTGSSNTAVTWSVQEPGGGTITTGGLYTAPNTAGTYHVIATSVADPTKSATTAVNVGATYSINGLINTSDSVGIEGVSVTLSGDKSDLTTSQAGGYYEFLNLQNGTYTVTPFFSGYTFSPGSTTTTINNSDLSNIDFIGTTDITPPSTPTGVEATVQSSSRIDLTWIASNDNVAVTGYKIYRDGTFIKTVSTTSAVDLGLNASTQYCYAISAFDEVGNESSQSGQVCAITNAEVSEDLSGTWEGTWQSSDMIGSGNLLVNFIQSGTSLSGTVSVSGSACMSQGNITGTVTPDSVVFGVVSGTSSVSFTGPYTYDSMSGTYSVVEGACVGDSGIFNLNRIIEPPVTEPPTFSLSWGTRGLEDGQFWMLNGVAVDEAGYVYTTSAYLKPRIQKFDGNGNFINKWGGTSGSGDGEFLGLHSIAVDTSGNVYVTESSGNRIQKFDSNGNFITKWGSFGRVDMGGEDGQFWLPQGIAVDSEGNVYVVDSNNDRIQKFDSNGNFITKWGSSGSGDREFMGAYGIAVGPAGNVYVTDIYHHRVQKFDSNGNFQTKWGTPGQEDGEFSFPRGVAIDLEGNVYIAEDYRIQKFDNNGNFLTKWGSSGSGDGEFNGLYGIAIDSTGNVYVADHYNNRIQKFGPAN